MNNLKKIMCITHFDLDGFLCYQILKWTFPNAVIDCLPINIQNFRNSFTLWLSNNNIEDYDKVFIMDLGVYEHKDLIDHENILIIDHHTGHSSITYDNAKSVIKDGYSSASKLTYMLFKRLYNLKLTKPQALLLLYVDDFDSYVLNFKESFQLNTVFWESTKKFEDFSRFFGNGFYGFNEHQQNIIKLHEMNVQKVRDNLVVYAGNVKIQGKDRYVCSTFSSRYINELADILIKEHNAEVVLIVNLTSEHVCYRKAKHSDVDLSILATVLGNGAGHKNASGSPLTEKFTIFSSNLTKIVDKTENGSG